MIFEMPLKEKRKSIKKILLIRIQRNCMQQKRWSKTWRIRFKKLRRIWELWMKSRSIPQLD